MTTTDKATNDKATNDKATNDKATNDAVMERLAATRDVMSVQRVFGEAYQVDGVTVIPVASLRGGGGGGSSEGTNGRGNGDGGDNSAAQGGGGAGAGMGFGVMAKPLGVYEIRNGTVTWRPAIDVMRITIGGQVLAAIALFTLGRILGRKR